MTQHVDRELSWDDTIVNDGPSYVLLPNGEYNFRVEKFERRRFQGSAKLPACNEAFLTIIVEGGDLGEAIVFHSLYLHSKTEGFLSAFFTSIGQKKEGEPVRMNWNAVVGARGRCEVYQDTYNGKTNNKIRSFLPYEKYLEHAGQASQQPMQQTPQQMHQAPFPGVQTQQQAPQQPQQQQFTPGNF